MTEASFLIELSQFFLVRMTGSSSSCHGLFWKNGWMYNIPYLMLLMIEKN